MEEVPDLYEAPYDPARPVVCFDERPRQLLAEVRPAEPPAPDKPAREDTEYERKGVRNRMMICEPQCGVREVLIAERQTKVDCAQSLRHLADRYPEADVIRVVLDHLNTHKAASFYEAFPPEEARRLARKLEFHDTPKHGSGLNIAEIEWAVLSNACLSRRIPDEEL